MPFVNEIGVRVEERHDCGCGDKAVLTMTVWSGPQDSLCALCAMELIKMLLGFLPLKSAEVGSAVVRLPGGKE